MPLKVNMSASTSSRIRGARLAGGKRTRAVHRARASDGLRAYRSDLRSTATGRIAPQSSRRFASLVAKRQAGLLRPAWLRIDSFAQLRLPRRRARASLAMCGERAACDHRGGLAGSACAGYDVGSLSTFGDAVGNKVKFRSNPSSFQAAMAQLIEHLSQPGRNYDISEYSPRHYASRLACIMHIGDEGAMPACNGGTGAVAKPERHSA